MNRLFRGLLIVVSIVLMFSVSGYAAGAANLMLIFDASGSMWGQIDGKAKITIAKEALDLIVNDLPEDINVGLVAYGHRKKGDCDDVETLIPIGPLNAGAFLEKVNGLSPKGKTPMVRSIRQTADAIKHLEDETTILLVSDGIETCDDNPCEAVAELQKLGIRFVLHVVGFDVGGETEAQLKCMAKAGGGEYFPARDAGNLKTALDKVIERTVEKNLKVSIFLNGEPIGGVVEVHDPRTGELAGSRFSSEKLPLLLGVSPGTYTVTVTDEWVQAGKPRQVFENVRISDTELKELTVNFGGGTLEIYAVKNGRPFKADAKVIDATGENPGGWVVTDNGDPAVFVLQPGAYSVIVRDPWGTGREVQLGPVDLVAGARETLRAAFDSGKIVVWTHRNGKPAHMSVKLIEAGGDEEYNDTYEDRPATFEKVPGSYRLVAIDSWGSLAEKDIGTVELSGGETLEKIVSFDSGKLVVWTHRNGKPAHMRVKIVDAQGEGEWYTTYEDQPATIEKMPGTYRIVAEDSWESQVKKDIGTVELAGGKTIEKIISFESGKGEVWTYRNGKPFHGRVKIIDAAGKEEWFTTYEDRPAAFEKVPGIYEIIAEDSWGDPVVRRKAGTLEIKAGETVKKICDFDAPPQENSAPSPSASGSVQAAPQAVSSDVTIQGSESANQASNTAARDLQELQTMAEQMQAMGEGQAARAMADAMGQLQRAQATMNASMAAGEETRSGGDAPSLPPGVGAQPVGAVGAPPPSVDYSNVGAVDTGGGLTEADERPEQGHNPYAGMSTEEMQAAFAKDVGMDGPQANGTAADLNDWQLGRTYPLQCKRHENTLNNRLDSYTEQARGLGRQDVLGRIDTARGNLEELAKQRKARIGRDALQQVLNRCVQEIEAIRITLAQAQ